MSSISSCNFKKKLFKYAKIPKKNTPFCWLNKLKDFVI